MKVSMSDLSCSSDAELEAVCRPSYSSRAFGEREGSSYWSLSLRGGLRVGVEDKEQWKNDGIERDLLRLHTLALSNEDRSRT